MSQWHTTPTTSAKTATPLLTTVQVLERTLKRHTGVVKTLLEGVECRETLRVYREEIRALEAAIAQLGGPSDAFVAGLAHADGTRA